MTKLPEWRGLVLPVVVLLGAQFAISAWNLRSDAIAAPSDVVVAGFGALLDGTMLWVTGQTLFTVTVGLVIGCLLGVLVGSLLGIFSFVSDLFEFSIEAMRPIPSVALIPLALLVYGFGYRMEIAIIAFSVFWPMLILTRLAVVDVEPRLVEVSRMLGFGTVKRVTKIFIPAALPRLFVAFRIAVGFALTVAVTVEIAANPLGLGYNMITAQLSLHPDLMFAMLIWVGVLGCIVNSGLLWLQRRWFGTDVPDELPQ